MKNATRIEETTISNNAHTVISGITGIPITLADMFENVADVAWADSPTCQQEDRDALADLCAAIIKKDITAIRDAFAHGFAEQLLGQDLYDQYDEATDSEDEFCVFVYDEDTLMTVITFPEIA